MELVVPMGGARWLGGLTSALLFLGLGGCGGGLPQEVSQAGTLPELMQISVEQYGSPVPISGSPELPTRMLSVKVTVTFTAPQRPARLSLVFATLDVPLLSSQSDVDLETVAPDVTASTGGRQVFLALVRVPALGVLNFDAVLIDRAGDASAPVSGHFSIQDTLSATQSNVIVESNQSRGQATPVVALPPDL